MVNRGHTMASAAGTLMQRKYFLSLTTALLLMITFPFVAFGQVLNQELNRIPSNGCDRLGTGGGSEPDTTGLGGNLSGMCNGQFGVVSTNGGGAASVQGSAASILNRSLLGRFEELRHEGQDGTEQSSSMTLSPLGILFIAGIRNLSVDSPFYAMSTAAGGDNATFLTSNQTRWKGFGFFATGRIESLDRNITTFQDGYKSTIF